MTSTLWPVRLIPRRSPPLAMGLAITVGSLGAAIFLRGLLLLSLIHI